MARELADAIAENRTCRKKIKDLIALRDEALTECDTLSINLELEKKQKAENLLLITKLTEQRDKAELDAKAGRVSYNLCNTDLEFTRQDLKKERKKHDETKAQLVGEKAQRDTLSEVRCSALVS
jgi:hypothetical protein